MKKYDIEAMIARHQAFVRKLLGPGKREQRYPTMEEYYDEERDFEELLEVRKWMLEMKAQNWQINGKPIVIGTPSEKNDN